MIRLFALAVALLLLNGCDDKPAQKPAVVQKAELSDLITAIHKGRVDEAAEVLKKGVDVNGRCKLGWTPLMHAAFSGNLEMVKLLVENGAVVDRDTIERAEDRGRAEVVEYLKSR